MIPLHNNQILLLDFRYMEREHNLKKSEVEKQLHLSVLDNLILSYTGVGFKGSKTGVEYEGFRIPDAGEVEIVSYNNFLASCVETLAEMLVIV